MNDTVLQARPAALSVTLPPPPPRPLPRPYPAKVNVPPLAAPAINPQESPHRFDRLSFASPKLDRPMFSGDEQAIHRDIADLPPAERFAASIVSHAIEILMGHRPARQLQTWMHPEVYDALLRRAGLGQRILGRPERCPAPRVKRVRVCEPRAGVAEASLVVFDGHKVRAAAVRLEVRRRKWHVTALEII